MPASIQERGTSLGDRFREPRTLAWEQLKGVHLFKTEKPTSMTEAFQDLGLDFEITTAPMFTHINGKSIAVKERRAIIHSGTEEVFGTTGTGYSPIQNMEIAQLLNPLLQKWELTAVANGENGRNLFVVFKGDLVEINGEPLQDYFWVVDSKDGKRAIRFQFSPNRLYCTNQLVTGFRSASFSANVHHNEGVGAEASFTVNVFQMLEVARKEVHQTFEAMGKTILTPDQIEAFIRTTIPDPVVPSRVQTLHALAAAKQSAGENIDDAIKELLPSGQMRLLDQSQVLYDLAVESTPIIRGDLAQLITRFNDEHPALANTAWAGYQAAAEYWDFSGRDKGDASQRSLLFGDRAKHKEIAFAAAFKQTNPLFATTTYSLPQSTRDLIGAERLARIQETDEERTQRQAAAVVRREEARKAQAATSGVDYIPRAERIATRIQKTEANLQKEQERLDALTLKENARIAALQARVADREAKAKSLAARRQAALDERKGFIAQVGESHPEVAAILQADTSEVPTDPSVLAAQAYYAEPETDEDGLEVETQESVDADGMEPEVQTTKAPKTKK